MYEFIDKTIDVQGTPINRQTMMAVQGFIGSNIRFLSDGSIVETNSNGDTKTTTFNSDGSITEVLQGQKTIAKKTIFNADGSITEVLI